MNGHFTIGELGAKTYFLGTASVLGLVFWFIAGDDLLSPLASFLKWQAQTLLPMVLLLLSHISLHQNAYFDQLPPWIKLIVSGLVGALLFSPIALLIDYLPALPTSSDQVALLRALANEWLAVTPPIVLVWLAMNLPWIRGFRLIKVGETKTEDRQTTPASEHKSASRQSVFLELLPRNIQAPLIYLKAELHYISVTTTKGKALVLYNLKDAIKELDPELGSQCHRSYWVNFSHIECFSKTGREGKITLSNGTHIPVSRRYRDYFAKFPTESCTAEPP
ncbi:MAG: LytTR family DNA-binding domain-containing protein [Pseudomonadota bacterium]